ncbi:hypothetical protein D3C85_1805820 [compost metagenome]
MGDCIVRNNVRGFAAFANNAVDARIRFQLLAQRINAVEQLQYRVKRIDAFVRLCCGMCGAAEKLILDSIHRQ